MKNTEENLGDHEDVIDRDDAVVVDDDGSASVRNVVEANDLVTVEDPAMPVPKSRNLL